MTLASIVRQRAADSPPRAGRHDATLAQEGLGWSLTLTLDRSDELGCLIWEMALRRTAPPPARETLASWADRIARQATGLLEALKVLEVDELRNEALLRSEQPSHWQGKNSYYEVLLQGTGTAWVRRYQAAADGTGKREQVAFALTHDALAKLADDLTLAR